MIRCRCGVNNYPASLQLTSSHKRDGFVPRLASRIVDRGNDLPAIGQAR